MAAEKHSIDALGQFVLYPVFGNVGRSLHIAQSNVLMAIAAILILGLLYLGMRPRAVVPGRLQAAAELLYEFVYNMVDDQLGRKAHAYFPFVFALFCFILFGNYLGLIPGSFTYTSHIAVTLTLALVVFVLGLIVSLRVQGLHFFAHFLPEGSPIFLAPLLVPIEIISYLSRPISLSIRLFANMVAGHVLFEVFAAFTIMLGSLGVIGKFIAVAPVAVNVAMFALELLVGALQAYVFAILTCIYLREAAVETHDEALV
ncbi:F-type H+-transporting ATPase subunit a [Endobacter medicaginis]|uniref:ATP synthase subunit a n=1 Tax=Endobacter medicaginis TaxID=1181271 RepID=A0A839V2H1_9PROT|nr:F0F1 ATP synthase subunit A [Endobacter medicaginis]MBB3174704.1 F-type H+-transporting ATPase subunit a [Endobacter medicaginis]MCX5474901.1 F0F1 ATP synthase subunit A [Endobacter medicaginis]NVN29498.1 F0F1 ATP synthase subunit A [Endobacter medicaginis]